MRVDEKMQSRVKSESANERRAYYYAGDESESIVRLVISALRDVPVLDEDGPLLFDSVDPDSLDRLFHGRASSRENYVRFRHGECLITAHATGEVVVISDKGDETSDHAR